MAAATDPADPAAFLSALPEPLDRHAEAALPLGLASAEEAAATAGRRIDELEISVRGQLLTLASDLLNAGRSSSNDDSSSSSPALAAVLAYLRSTIDLCLHTVQLAEALDAADGEETSAPPSTSVPPPCYKGMAHPVVRKLPFVLLEDTIDALPPSVLKTIWTSGPTEWIADLAANTGTGGTANLFQRGSQFLLLKSCNKLLRKLSNRDRDAAFAGSVMTLLAKVFPLSERSAVNVLGTFNVANVTDFEDAETFARHVLGAGDAEGADADVTMEDAEGEGEAEAEAESVDYPFYRTFWGVQKVFTDPGIILDGIKDGGAASSAGAAAGGGKAPPAAAEAAAESFNAQPAIDFVKDVRTVLTALEGRPFPEEVVRQSKSR